MKRGPGKQSAVSRVMRMMRRGMEGRVMIGRSGGNRTAESVQRIWYMYDTHTHGG